MGDCYSRSLVSMCRKSQKIMKRRLTIPPFRRHLKLNAVERKTWKIIAVDPLAAPESFIFVKKKQLPAEAPRRMPQKRRKPRGLRR